MLAEMHMHTGRNAHAYWQNCTAILAESHHHTGRIAPCWQNCTMVGRIAPYWQFGTLLANPHLAGNIALLNGKSALPYWQECTAILAKSHHHTGKIAPCWQNCTILAELRLLANLHLAGRIALTGRIDTYWRNCTLLAELHQLPKYPFRITQSGNNWLFSAVFSLFPIHLMHLCTAGLAMGTAG